MVFYLCFQVFEKKNQKSAQSILLLQKKLEEYQKKVRELEEHGIHRSSQKIRGLGQGIAKMSKMSKTIKTSKTSKMIRQVR
jgi:hypothetical protein